jgi:GTPase Era involved in 16S rRNA processing
MHTFLACVVGPTGVGKSTLVNYLYDPKGYYTTPLLLKGQNSKSETKESTITPVIHEEISYSISTYERKNICFSFMDTPGLDEDPQKDMEHSVDILRNVISAGGVAAVIITLKLGMKLEENFRRSVKYYLELFYSLRDNLILVLTDVPTDPRSIQKRQRDGVNVDDWCKDFASKVKQLGGLTYLPQVITIDANPLYDPSDPEYQAQLQARNMILQQIAQFKVVPTSDMKFRKTPSMEQEDRIRVEVHEKFIILIKLESPRRN